jgi:hypothetical protein
MTCKHRPKVVNFRLSSDELATLKSLVKSSGMRQQDYLLRAALAPHTPRQVANQQADLELLRELMRELSREGNNLNQIARRLNVGDAHAAAMIDDMYKEMTILWQSLRWLLRRRQ